MSGKFKMPHECDQCAGTENSDRPNMHEDAIQAHLCLHSVFAHELVALVTLIDIQ